MQHQKHKSVLDALIRPFSCKEDPSAAEGADLTVVNCSLLSLVIPQLTAEPCSKTVRDIVYQGYITPSCNSTLQSFLEAALNDFNVFCQCAHTFSRTGGLIHIYLLRPKGNSFLTILCFSFINGKAYNCIT